jgi:hypothetical protein
MADVVQIKRNKQPAHNYTRVNPIEVLNSPEYDEEYKKHFIQMFLDTNTLFVGIPEGSERIHFFSKEYYGKKGIHGWRFYNKNLAIIDTFLKYALPLFLFIWIFLSGRILAEMYMNGFSFLIAFLFVSFVAFTINFYEEFKKL